MKKITLVEIDIKSLVDTFLTWEPGIRFTTMAPDPAPSFIDNDGFTWFWPGQGQKRINVQAVRLIEKTTKVVVDMLATSSLQNLRLQQNGFYYEETTGNLFLNISDDYDVIWKYSRNVGQTQGFTDAVDRIRSDQNWYSDIYYNPLLNKSPIIKYKKETLYYGVFQFPTVSIDFINNDGFFDNYGQNIFNNSIIIKIGNEGDDYSQFEKVYDGVVSSYNTTEDSFRVTGNDKRKFLTRKIPINGYTISEYPFIDDNNVDNKKPLAWGQVRNVEPVILNETNPVAADYLYYLCSNLTSVQNVQVNKKNFVGYTVNLDQGYISIPSASALDSSDNFHLVTVDFTGGIANGLAVIREILNDYIGVAYTIDNYNVSEWGANEDKAEDIAIFIDEPKEIKSILEKISFSQFGLFDVQQDGRLTFKDFATKDVLKTAILFDDWVTTQDRNEDPSQFLTKASFKYDKDYTNDAFKNYENNINEDEILQKYGLHKEKTFVTVLKNSVDIITFSNNIMNERKDVIVTAKRALDIKGANFNTKFLDIETGDLISAANDRDQEDYKVYEINGKDINVEKEQIVLNMRFIKELDLNDFVKEYFYKCEGGASLLEYNNSVNTDYSFIDENINTYSNAASLYNTIYNAPSFCYYSTLRQSGLGFILIEFNVNKTGSSKVWFQYRDISSTGIIPNFFGIVELTNGANVIVLPKVLNLQYRLFGANLITEIVDIQEISLAD